VSPLGFIYLAQSAMAEFRDSALMFYVAATAALFLLMICTKTAQPLETIHDDLQTLDALKRQLAAIASGDRLPPAPTGMADYAGQASTAAFYLYQAAAIAGLADARHLPQPVIDGIMKGMQTPRPGVFPKMQ
jgi:hypothetical protein